MKINDITAELVSEIEYLIASECYNPNSYDGYTGDEGCGFRYPVVIKRYDKEGNPAECKTKMRLKNNILHSFEAKEYKNAKYKFGSNHLYICQGIEKALSFIEERYNLDFEKLETAYLEEQTNGQA